MSIVHSCYRDRRACEFYELAFLSYIDIYFLYVNMYLSYNDTPRPEKMRKEPGFIVPDDSARAFTRLYEDQSLTI